MLGALQSFTVYAATDWGTCLQSEDVATFKCLEPLFANIVQIVISLAGIALFVMVVVSGFGFLFSAGDPKKLEQAKGTLTNAMIGLVVIVAAYVILRILQIFTGVNLTIFQVNIPN